MHLARRLALAALLLGVASSGARAETEVAAAKRLFLSGTKHFNLSEYEAALNDFKEGYRHKEDPVFLFNIAQCYRQLKGQEEDAIRFYRSYLREQPLAPNRSDVEQRIVALEHSIAARAQPAPIPPVAPAITPSPPAVVVVSAPPKKQPLYKKWWLWTAVGGVVVVGLGVGLGVGLTRHSSSTNSLPPIDLP